MSVERTRQGTFRVRLPIHGERGSIGIFDTEDEARDAEALALSRMAGSVGPTLGTWGKAWLDDLERDGHGDIRNDRSRWRTHVTSDPIADRPLIMLTPADVEAWIDRVRRKKGGTPFRKTERPISAKTVRECVLVVRRCVEAAKGKHLSTNPVDGVNAKKMQRATRKKRDNVEEPWTFLEPEEQTKLTAAIPVEAHALMIRFAMLTGIREGEQFNAELRDLRLADESPHLYVRFGSKGKAPKNGRPRRVYLSAEAVEVATRWLEVLPTYARKNEEGLVFPTSGGSRCQRGKTPLHVSRWDTKRKKGRKVFLLPEYLRAAGIVRGVRWHDLRHTCASSLVAGWWGRRWTLAEVQEHLGHRSITTTERYAHLADSAYKRAIRETRRAESLPADLETTSEISGNVLELLVGRQGLEPWTYGLKDSGSLDVLRALTMAGGHRGGQFSKRVRAALASLEAEDPIGWVQLASLLEDLLGAGDAAPSAGVGS
jgi:integrase